MEIRKTGLDKEMKDCSREITKLDRRMLNVRERILETEEQEE